MYRQGRDPFEEPRQHRADESSEAVFCQPGNRFFNLLRDIRSVGSNHSLLRQALMEVHMRSSADSDRLKLMLDYIQDHFSERVNLEQIAGAAGISVRECTRCFKRCIETSPAAYLNQYRLRIACRMLRETAESVLAVSEACGFSSPSYFTKAFRDALGSTPLEYRKAAIF